MDSVLFPKISYLPFAIKRRLEIQSSTLVFIYGLQIGVKRQLGRLQMCLV